MKPDLSNLMQQAKELQQKMQDAQKELETMSVKGSAGGGLVHVTLTGKHECKKVEIDEDLIDEDKSMIEDLVTAAINDAVHKVEKETRGKMSSLTGGLNMPEGFGDLGGS